MAYVGPIGKDIGVTMDETLAMMGVLGNFNIRGSMAGTSTRRLFTLMATDSQRMSEIFGKSFTDINGNFIGVTAAMQLMADATKDMAAPERLAKFNEAFGMLGVASSSTLASMITQYSELKTAITDSTGEAQKQADMMESGVGGSLRRLMATWTEFKTTIITMWADTISNILDTLTGWVTSASDLWNTAQNEASAAFLVIGVAWQWVMDNFHDAATVSTGVVIMAITFLGDTCYNTFMWIKDVAVITSQNLGDAFGTVLSNTIENFKILGRNIREVFVSVWDYIKNIGKSRTFELAFEPFKAELDGLVTRELPKFENKASFVTDMVANKVKESLDNLDKRASLGDQIDAALQELQAMQGGKLEPKAQWDPTKTPADRGNQFSPRTTPAPTDTVKTGATAQIGLQGTAKAYEIIMKARNDKHTKLLEKIAENTGKTAEPVRPGFEGAIAEGLM
jgi:hypothetical protein